MLKFLLIFFIVIYLLGLLVKWFFASLINKASSGAGFDSGRESRRKEGEVSVDKTPGKSKLFTKDEGEYVDYEEIKD
ncbi:MAG: DUF4834 domain-containing protein [Bacteroidetes bacterium HGW-Bacteroidetes-4]|jgi:uncharacterized protein HemY|nr:MAG: DUF4834 domain-containing protein [Bacteroidetes bacterium HGW-Bacteroidetes-4]